MLLAIDILTLEALQIPRREAVVETKMRLHATTTIASQCAILTCFAKILLK
jgi:hypothetical protein